MKADVLALTELTFLAQISMFIFMSVFVGALVMVLRPGAKKHYAELANLPLDD